MEENDDTGREERAQIIKDTVDKDRIRGIKEASDFKSILFRNFIWILTVTIGVGTVLATVSYQSKDLETQRAMIANDHERIAAIEKVDVQLDAADDKVITRLVNIENGIKELKDTIDKLDIKINERMSRMSDKTQVQFDELKKILYKPVVGVDNDSRNLVSK